MCGIAGYASLDGRPVDAGPIDEMLCRLEHRGPDDRGVFFGDGIVLGHRRLSILDPEGGHQPLHGRSPDTTVVANGEIYDFRSLRSTMEAAGDRGFGTGSDTEVLAHAYDAWGLDFLDRMDGMFAFALWDGARRRLVLARDRMGEKPLYHAVANGMLLFASELRSLLAHPALSPELDPVSLSQYLALEYVPAPRSILAGVGKLEPGCALVLEDGAVRSLRYWTVPLPSDPGEAPPYPEAVARLRASLDDAVRSRLVSDVPLGVFLSGGIDSSTVAALAARHGALDTFSIGFDEASFDESDWAERVARHIGSRHHRRVVTSADMLALVPTLGRLLDEPIGDASIVPTRLLSEFARGAVTVALGGDGGDELFGGYPMHRAHRFTARIGPLGRAAPLAARAASLLPTSHGNFTLPFKLAAYARGATAPAPLNHGLWMSSFAPAEQRALLAPDLLDAASPDENAFAPLEAAWARSEGAPLLTRAMHLDATTYLPNDVLTKVDRASMSVGLEVRAPFLDPATVGLAFSLPDRYHMRGLTGKRLLKDATRDLLPDAVRDRAKKGFGAPVGAWLHGPLRELMQDTLSDDAVRRAGVFRPETVAELVRDHAEGCRDLHKPLWTLLAFELWRREIFSC